MQSSPFPHNLIARPVEEEEEAVEILLERPPQEEHTLEMLDDDDGILIKEAEKVIEQIQDQISHIASRPKPGGSLYQNQGHCPAVPNFREHGILRPNQPVHCPGR